jgi:hypothetical protein
MNEQEGMSWLVSRVLSDLGPYRETQWMYGVEQQGQVVV